MIDKLINFIFGKRGKRCPACDKPMIRVKLYTSYDPENSSFQIAWLCTNHRDGGNRYNYDNGLSIMPDWKKFE